MIDVFFRVGDMAASARFNADEWSIVPSGRLILQSTGRTIAVFEYLVWQYVCQVKSEVAQETKVISVPGNAKVEPVLGR